MFSNSQTTGSFSKAHLRSLILVLIYPEPKFFSILLNRIKHALNSVGFFLSSTTLDITMETDLFSHRQNVPARLHKGGHRHSSPQATRAPPSPPAVGNLQVSSPNRLQVHPQLCQAFTLDRGPGSGSSVLFCCCSWVSVPAPGPTDVCFLWTGAPALWPTRVLWKQSPSCEPVRTRLFFFF